jgi:menaquinone-dependent protoporphyrinogen oxidase
MTRILVAYATKKGSTAEVAEAIAAQLGRLGFDTDLEPAGDVRDLEAYDAVVLGGSLYMGRWHADARHMLKEHREVLSRLPIAVFAMGPLTAGDHDLEGSRKQLDRALAKRPEIDPISVAIFGGVVDPDKLSFPFNHMPASDARDWDAIRDWTDGVAERVRATAPVPA